MHGLWYTCLCHVPPPLLAWKTPVTTNDFVEVKISEKFNNLVKEGAADEMVIARLITRAATDITFHDTHHHSTLYYKTTIPQSHTIPHRTTSYHTKLQDHHSTTFLTIPHYSNGKVWERLGGKKKALHSKVSFALFCLSKQTKTGLVTTRINNCPRYFIYVPYPRQWRIQH